VQKRSSGFTLIELLVVIAIIAILAALLLPVLARAKLKGTEAVCLGCQKQLVSAMMMYCSDNDEQILPMSSYDPSTPTPYWTAGGFWGGSWDHTINGPNIPSGLPEDMVREAQAALMTNNPLSQYLANPGVYACPGDTRLKINTKTEGWAYGSYSKTQNFGGEENGNYFGQGNTCRKLTDAKAPANTFVFIEDANSSGSSGGGSKGYNVGTWVVNWQALPPFFTFNDPPAQYHGNVGTFSFADGHAEFHKWMTAAAIQAGLNAALGQPFLTGYQGVPSDQSFVHDNFRFPGWK